MTKSQLATRDIVNKAFSGIVRLVVSYNFMCASRGNRPPSLTCHTANVITQY